LSQPYSLIILISAQFVLQDPDQISRRQKQVPESTGCCCCCYHQKTSKAENFCKGPKSKQPKVAFSREKTGLSPKAWPVLPRAESGRANIRVPPSHIVRGGGTLEAPLSPKARAGLPTPSPSTHSAQYSKDIKQLV
jgi:hypothetical protein